AAAKGGRVHALPLNYGHDGELEQAIKEARHHHGQISLAITWIHNDAPRALPVIAANLRGQAPRAKIFQILESEAADPALAAVARGKGRGSVRDERLAPLREKVERGERLSLDEGDLLFTTRDLWTVLELADGVRRRLHGDVAYYNINRHLNYSNVCALSCKFC